MRIQTEVIVPGIEDSKLLSVEVANDVITFYLGYEALFSTDFKGNFDEFVLAIMKVWAGWQDTTKRDKP